MLERFRQRFADMRALTVLMRSAEGIARNTDDSPPGAEHFLLAALEHPDGSARRVFDRFGVTPEATRAAIQQQYADALKSIGLDDGVSAVNDRRRDADTARVVPSTTVYDARESGRTLLRRMADQQGRHRFKSARVLGAAVDIEHGVTARTLRVLDIDLGSLRAAVADEIERSPYVDTGAAGSARKF